MSDLLETSPDKSGTLNTQFPAAVAAAVVAESVNVGFSVSSVIVTVTSSYASQPSPPGARVTVHLSVYSPGLRPLTDDVALAASANTGVTPAGAETVVHAPVSPAAGAVAPRVTVVVSSEQIGPSEIASPASAVTWSG